MLPTYNVLAEVFSNQITPALIPLSEEEQIRQALTETDAINTTYMNDETCTASVPHDWHKEILLEFSEWLTAHIPGYERNTLALKYEDIPMIKQLIRYQAEDMTDFFADVLDAQQSRFTEKDVQLAHLIAMLIAERPGTKTVNLIIGEDIYSIFLPDYSKLPVNISELEEYYNEHTNAQTAACMQCFHTLSALMLVASKEPESVVAVCSYDEPGKNTIYLYAFIDGQPIAVDPQSFKNIIETIEHGEDIANALPMTDYKSKSEFEYRVLSLGAMMGNAVINATMETHQNVVKNEAEDNFVNTTSYTMYPTPFVGEEAADNEEAVALALEQEDLELSYVDLHEKIFNMDASIYPSDASKLLSDIVIEQAAEEVLNSGHMEETGEKASDFIQSIELGFVMFEHDETELAPIREFVETIEMDKELRVSDELFEGLLEEQKADIEVLMNNMLMHPDTERTLMTVTGNGKDQPIKMIKLPVFGEEIADRQFFVSAIKSLLIPGVLNPSATTIITRHNPQEEDISVVNLIKWQDGRWSNGNMKEIFKFLNEVPVDRDLGIHNGDQLFLEEVFVDGTAKIVETPPDDFDDLFD